MKPYYQDAAVTIYHGRCEDVIPLLDLSAVGLLLADPPYGLNVQKPNGSIGMSPKTAGRSAYLQRKGLVNMPAKSYPTRCEGDGEPFDPALLLSLGLPSILWGGNHFADRLPPSPSWLIWDKREGQTSDNFADCEMAWSNLGGPARLFSHYWRGLVRKSEQGTRLHPMQKPVALMKWCIAKAGITAGIVLDPYTGSGPVLRAAADAGLQAIGIEVEEWCCEIAAKRLEQGALPLAAAT